LSGKITKRAIKTEEIKSSYATHAWQQHGVITVQGQFWDQADVDWILT